MVLEPVRLIVTRLSLGKKNHGFYGLPWDVKKEVEGGQEKAWETAEACRTPALYKETFSIKRLLI